MKRAAAAAAQNKIMMEVFSFSIFYIIYYINYHQQRENGGGSRFLMAEQADVAQLVGLICFLFFLALNLNLCLCGIFSFFSRASCLSERTSCFAKMWAKQEARWALTAI